MLRPSYRQCPCIIAHPRFWGTHLQQQHSSDMHTNPEKQKLPCNTSITDGLLTNISLMKDHNPTRIHFPAVSCWLGCHSKPKRNVWHGVNDNAGVGWCIFSYSSQSRLHHMVSIHILHLCRGLDPYLQPTKAWMHHAAHLNIAKMQCGHKISWSHTLCLPEPSA